MIGQFVTNHMLRMSFVPCDSLDGRLDDLDADHILRTNKWIRLNVIFILEIYSPEALGGLFWWSLTVSVAVGDWGHFVITLMVKINHSCSNNSWHPVPPGDEELHYSTPVFQLFLEQQVVKHL